MADCAYCFVRVSYLIACWETIKIYLSVGRVHTTHNGVVDAWKCRTFKLSERAKEIQELVEAMLNG